MKTKLRILSVALLGATVSSCTTTYDAYGNPQKSVDPTMATVGVVAAGLIGAAVANNNNNDDHRYHRDRRHHRDRRYHRQRHHHRRGHW